MGEVRFNPITGEAMILSTTRADRPGAWSEDATRGGREICPFCPGHENETPPEIERTGGAAWETRAVPNKYPAIFHPSNAPHEVLIDSPRHDLAFEENTRSELAAAIALWARRARVQSEYPTRRYVSVFRNEGRGAGQSIPHPHSQLLAIDFVPSRIQRELEGFLSGPCPLCALVTAETRLDEVIIDQSDSLLLFCPRAARLPFEMWVTSRAHVSDWTMAAVDELAGMLLSSVRRLRAIHPTAPFNLGMHTAPLRTEGAARFHWYAEVTPRLTNLAGFELSTGSWINIESPERAAEQLRQCVVRQD